MSLRCCVTALVHRVSIRLFFFFFNDTATTEIYTLSLHDALPIAPAPSGLRASARVAQLEPGDRAPPHVPAPVFEGLGVHGRHQATGGEPADSYKHPRRPVFQAAVQHAGLEVGR